MTFSSCGGVEATYTSITHRDTCQEILPLLPLQIDLSVFSTKSGPGNDVVAHDMKS